MHHHYHDVALSPFPVPHIYQKHVGFTILQKDNPQRRRPPLENRLRDDRVHRRDHERIDNANDGERIDNVDRQSKAGGPDSRNHDESMYDAYGGQDISGVPPFGSDMPPVLMPVPGAGLVFSPLELSFSILKFSPFFVLFCLLTVLRNLSIAGLWDLLFLPHPKSLCRCSGIKEGLPHMMAMAERCGLVLILVGPRQLLLFHRLLDRILAECEGQCSQVSVGFFITVKKLTILFSLVNITTTTISWWQNGHYD